MHSPWYTEEGSRLRAVGRSRDIPCLDRVPRDQCFYPSEDEEEESEEEETSEEESEMSEDTARFICRCGGAGIDDGDKDYNPKQNKAI